jgi:ubiquinone/menaquinone biosynthesis C-methylase UbiE
MRNFLRLFFYLLYHQFAWSYDLVAAVVSLGRWKSWVFSVMPYLNGRILEIGFGPGHLQQAFGPLGLAAFGLDESLQMSRMARRRLHRKGYPVRLARGAAKKLPFPENSFESVVATFPTEYIFEPPTLAEIRRVLAPGGQLVITPSAWITGTGQLERLAAWLFKVTGQAGMLEAVIPAIQAQIRRGGFAVRHEVLDLVGSRVLVVIATKR